jgi:type IV secretion system protein VirD4
MGVGFIETYRRNRAALLATGRPLPQPRRQPPLPPPRSPHHAPSPPPPGGFSFADPPPIKLGHYRNPDGTVGAELKTWTERAIVLFGLNGAGKSTRFLIELLMTTSHRSLFITDLKGELAAQTGAARARYSKVFYFNPYRMHGLPHHGCNPLAGLRCNDPALVDKCRSIAEAMIEANATGDAKHWIDSARSIAAGACMFEVILAAREKRLPSLLNVRNMLVEPDRFENFIEGGKRMERQVAGLKFQAERMLASGNRKVINLVGRFVRKHGLNELSGIQSTFITATDWMESEAMIDLEADDIDLSRIRKEPVTIFYMLPIDEIENKRPLTRIMLSAALNAHLSPGPMSTLFVLDEFRVAINDLPIVKLYWSVIRGFRAQLMPILQSATQLQTLFKDEWQNYLGQAGVVFTIGPPNDPPTSDWMSERSGTTTILQKSYNEGRGANTGDGINGGANVQVGGGVGTSQGSAFNHGENVTGGLSVAQVEQRAFTPQELRNMADGNGLIWLPGQGTGCIPFYAPPYWRRRASWVSRVRPNPYRIT